MGGKKEGWVNGRTDDRWTERQINATLSTASVALA